MDFELVVVRGRSGSTTIKLTEPVTTIGRHDDCQLRIKSSQVSRRHCELFEKKGHLLVKDLGSANGTLVNGKRLEGQLVLEPGDEITIGPVMLRVVKVGAGAPKKGSPGDTAVAASPVAATAEPADDFTIALDESVQSNDAATVPTPAPAPTKAPKKSPVHDEDAIADFLMDINIDGDEETTEEEPPTEVAEPAAAPAAQRDTAAAKPEDTPAAPKAQEKEKEAETHDDAIADFLLDIQIDEDD